tara:strand:- start:14347 stop:15561 length:1215 start_codon:yes stop_codon:yes gene_type:complete
MSHNFNILQNKAYVFSENYKKFLDAKPFPIFSKEVIVYLNELSKEINRDLRIREFPDVATFAFFCRTGNLNKLSKDYIVDNQIRMGRGLVFHVPPSNVPVNFAYSLVAGLLAGNKNIVRLPSKDYTQMDIILKAMDRVGKLGAFSRVSQSVVFIKYPKENQITKILSKDCNVRVIWGGDSTINKIRKNPLSPKSYDVTFSDRISLCVINADKFTKNFSPDNLAKGFYNDTYLFDQNACTAPHIIIWLGSKSKITKSKIIFWEAVHAIVKKQYDLQAISAIDKLCSICNLAIHDNVISLNTHKDNLVWRVKLDKLGKGIDKFRSSGGYFYEYDADSIFEINEIINEKYQTLSYYGFSKTELRKFIANSRLKGIDRIVPIGRTLEFSLTWDGFDLIYKLSRRVEVL